MTEASSNSSAKILVVDDLGSARKIVRKILAELGYTNVEEACDGEEALRKIEMGDFSLIISDWEMPKLKGIELIKKLREREVYKTLPFIIVTSLNHKEHVMQAFEAGISDYIAKPFSSEILGPKLQKLLQTDAD